MFKNSEGNSIFFLNLQYLHLIEDNSPKHLNLQTLLKVTLLHGCFFFMFFKNYIKFLIYLRLLWPLHLNAENQDMSIPLMELFLTVIVIIAGILGSSNVLKRHSRISAFLWILQNFWHIYFYKHLQMAAPVFLESDSDFF